MAACLGGALDRLACMVCRAVAVAVHQAAAPSSPNSHSHSTGPAASCTPQPGLPAAAAPCRYVSTRDALEALYDRVSPGGLVYVDDYGAYTGEGWAGAGGAATGGRQRMQAVLVGQLMGSELGACTGSRPPGCMCCIAASNQASSLLHCTPRFAQAASGRCTSSGSAAASAARSIYSRCRSRCGRRGLRVVRPLRWCTVQHVTCHVMLAAGSCYEWVGCVPHPGRRAP